MAFVWSLLVSIVLVVVDQVTKYLAVAHLDHQPPIVLWPNVFELQYHENRGIAFSMLQGLQWVIVPITILVMLLIAVILWRSPLTRSFMFRASCVLILAGGIGNLIDRVALGYVIDFLYVRLIDFPIFNFADCCVVIGAGLMIVYVLFCYKDEDNMPLRTLLFDIEKKGR